MKTFTVSFFGHRRLENALEIERLIEGIVKPILRENEFVEFLIGRDGEFDILVASIIRRCKRIIRNDNSSLVWVLPYPTAELNRDLEEFQNYYDSIEINHASHYKSAHQERNRQMIDRSDLVVCYVAHSDGGAYQSMKYTKTQKKRIINIAE